MDPLEVVFFPGILFHEFSHFLSCILVGAKVTRVRFKSVTHKKTGPWRGFIISFAPFLVGSLTSVLLFWVGHRGLKYFFALSQLGIFSIGVFFWLGFSIATFCFPSETDARNAMNTLFEFYLNSLSLREGWFRWMFCLLTLIPMFTPMAILASFMLFFSRIKGLGLLWGILLFLGVGFLVGAW